MFPLYLVAGAWDFDGTQRQIAQLPYLMTSREHGVLGPKKLYFGNPGKP